MKIEEIQMADTWWRMITAEERMNIYFKYFTSGIHDDCMEWWWGLIKEERIKIYKNNINKKEDKKVKKEIDYEKIPYFDVKMVGIKKEDKCKYYTHEFVCPICGEMLEHGKKTCTDHNKGNFVNGENLDKIKFPCWCSYRFTKDGEDYLGLLMEEKFANSVPTYEVINIQGQRKVNCGIPRPVFTSLRDLIKEYQVKILKGKVVLFEEVK